MTSLARTRPRKPMTQEERSEKSREQILAAALDLFSHRGYGSTGVREIAEAAGVSKGNVYHHFPDKEAIFRELLERYFAVLSDPEFPFNKVVASGAFPDNLEEMGQTVRDMVRDYRPYVALIYVDVVEFDGSHIRKFYEGMAERFERFLTARGLEQQIRGRIAPDLSPGAAVMLATRIFLNYFSVEILFGVRNHFGKATDEVVGEISRILRHGMLR